MTSQAQQHAGVRLERTFPVPPDRLYRAWLEPGWQAVFTKLEHALTTEAVTS